LLPEKINLKTLHTF